MNQLSHSDRLHPKHVMNGHLLADENHIAANVMDDNAYAIAMDWWHYIINDWKL